MPLKIVKQTSSRSSRACSYPMNHSTGSATAMWGTRADSVKIGAMQAHGRKVRGVTAATVPAAAATAINLGSERKTGPHPASQVTSSTTPDMTRTVLAAAQVIITQQANLCTATSRSLDVKAPHPNARKIRTCARVTVHRSHFGI